MLNTTKSHEVLAKVAVNVISRKLSDDGRKMPYGKVYEELSCFNGIRLKGERIVVPPKLIEDFKSCS